MLEFIALVAVLDLIINFYFLYKYQQASEEEEWWRFL